MLGKGGASKFVLCNKQRFGYLRKAEEENVKEATAEGAKNYKVTIAESHSL